jgi:hypothetical protein
MDNYTLHTLRDCVVVAKEVWFSMLGNDLAREFWVEDLHPWVNSNIIGCYFEND